MTAIGQETGLGVEREYERHAAGLTKFATSLVGPTDASDVVQDTMVSLLRSGALREARDPAAVMYRAVYNNATSWHRSVFRRRKREQAFADALRVHDPDHRPDVLDALSNLSARQRACIFLAYWEDLTPSQIGDRLGLAEGTVKAHLARARAQLRSVIGE